MIAVPSAPQWTCRNSPVWLTTWSARPCPPIFRCGSVVLGLQSGQRRRSSHPPRHPDYRVDSGARRRDGGQVIRRVAVDVPGGVPPREMLSELIGDARIVLIGESSHGTHEFYEARAEITKWLIEEKEFCAVAAEADCPTPTGSTATYAAWARTALGSRRYAALSGSRRGCGVTRWSAISSNGCGPTIGSAKRRIGVKPVSTAWISTVCIVRCRRWSAF